MKICIIYFAFCFLFFDFALTFKVRKSSVTPSRCLPHKPDGLRPRDPNPPSTWDLMSPLMEWCHVGHWMRLFHQWLFDVMVIGVRVVSESWQIDSGSILCPTPFLEKTKLIISFLKLIFVNLILKKLYFSTNWSYKNKICSFSFEISFNQNGSFVRQN